MVEEDQVLKLEYEDLGPGHIPVHAHPVDEAIATTLVRPHLMDDDDILPIPVYPLDTATAHTPVHPL